MPEQQRYDDILNQLNQVDMKKSEMLDDGLANMSRETAQQPVVPQGPLHTDRRLLRIFNPIRLKDYDIPPNLPLTQVNNGAKEYSAPFVRPMEESLEYMRAYMSGDAERRRPYVQAGFDAVDNCRLRDISLDNPQDIAQNFFRYRDELNILCYAQNLREDNPNQYEEHYNTPMKKHLEGLSEDLSAPLSSYFVEFSAKNGFYSQDTTTYAPITPEQMEIMQIRPDLIFARIGAESAIQSYHIQMSIAENRQPEPLRLAVNRDCLPPMVSYLESELAGKNPSVTPQTKMQVASFFDSTFSTFFDRSKTSGKLIDQQELNRMDLIFINGKSANELYGQKYSHMDPRQREAAMRTEIVGAMTSGKNRIEMAAVGLDANEKVTTKMISIEPNLKEIEPRKKDDQEYSWIRRNLFPYTCKTRSEKQTELQKNDPDKQKRQAEAIKKVEEKLQLHAKKVELHDKVVEAKKQFRSPEMDKEYFREALGDRCKNASEFSNEFSQMQQKSENIHTMDSATSRRSLCDMIMLSRGHTMTELVSNGPGLDAEKQLVGRQVVEMIEKNDIEAMKNIYTKCYHAMNSQKMPIYDPANPESILEGFAERERLAVMAKNLPQMFEGPIADLVADEIRPIAFDRMTAPLESTQPVFAAMNQLTELYATDAYVSGKVAPEGDQATIVGNALKGHRLIESVTPDFAGKTIYRADTHYALVKMQDSLSTHSASKYLASNDKEKVMQDSLDYMIKPGAKLPSKLAEYESKSFDIMNDAYMRGEFGQVRVANQIITNSKDERLKMPIKEKVDVKELAKEEPQKKAPQSHSPKPPAKPAPEKEMTLGQLDIHKK